MIRNPFVTLAAVLGLSAAALAAPQESRMSLSAVFEPATAKPGDVVTLKITADIEVGYHVYGSLDQSMPTTLTIEKPGGLVPKGTAVVPPGTAHETLGMVNYWVEGTAIITQKLEVPADAGGGEVKVTGRIDYMACTPSACDPPTDEPFTATLTVEGKGEAEPPPVDPPVAGVQNPFEMPGFQDPFAQDAKITVTPRVEPSPARAGERVKLVLGVEVEPGWHVYGSADTKNFPTTLTLRELQSLEALGAAAIPPGEPHEGATAGHWLPSSFEIEQWLLVPEGAEPGTVTVQGAVDYMPCTEHNCLAPTDEPFEVDVVVEAGAARAAHVPPADSGTGGDVPAEPGTPDAATSAQDDLPAAGLKMSLLALILASIGGGLFALAMPCTYPMIPITVSFFTKQAEKRGGNVLGLALVYGAGIIAIFSLLGAVVAFGTFGMTGDKIIYFAGHWATNTVLALLFLLFAIVLLGFINLQPPQFLMNVANKASATGGYLGVFMMGATLVIASFTCTAPIVGTLLGATVQSDPMFAILGMAIFGFTMAVPFVALSLLPGKAKSMPKSGEWMHTLKVTLGFVELAAVLKFVSNVDIALGWGMFPREGFLMSWALIFFLTGLFLLGVMRGRGTAYEGIGKGRMTTAIVFFCLMFYYLYGSAGFKLDAISTALAPPYSGQSVLARGGAAERHEIVKDDYEKALRLAREDDRLLLVNFTGFV